MTNRIAKWFSWLLLAPAILPLVYVEGLLYPYVAPKTLLFRALFIVAAAGFAYLLLSGHSFYFSRLRNWISWIPGALLALAYGTSLIGIDFYHSFWSIFDRGDGLLTMTAIIGFFYFILLYADRPFLRRLFSISAWVGSIVAVYGVLQWIQTVTGMEIPLITDPRGRLGGTFGNAAFLAAYLGMTLFATLAVVKEFSGKWRKALYAGAALQLFAAILTSTRGTLLAILLASTLTALYLAWRGEGATRKYARFGVVGVVIFAALFFLFRGPLTQFPFEPVRRIASISLSDVTVSSRFFVWKNVLSESLEKPLTGYGAEHVDVLFNRVYDPAGILEEWFDRSHNAYLDYFAQYGIFGLLLFSALLATLALTAWRLLRVGDKYAPFILLMVVVYAAQNFFVFDTAMTLWLLFAVFAALLAYRAAGENVAVSSSRFKLKPVIPIVVGGAILILLYPVSIQPLRANLLLAEGYMHHIADVGRSVDTMQKGLSLNTYADIEYGYQAYEMYSERQANLLEGTDRVAAYRFALETLTKNYEKYPYDARTATYLAHVLDLVPPEETADEVFLREVVLKAIELSPKHAQAHYILANISLKKGDKAGQAGNVAERNRFYREGIAVLEEYVKMVPNYANPRYLIANLYLVIGEEELAARWASEGQALYKGDMDTARRAVRYYIAIEDWATALRFNEEISRNTPQDYPVKYDLAKLYFLTGNKERAQEIVNELQIESPGLVESDAEFMKAIEGTR